MTRLLLCALLAAPLVFLAGCGADPCPGGCAAGLTCDVASGTCVPDLPPPGGACQRDLDCAHPATPACDTDRGRCVECLEASDCPGGERCNPVTLSCEPVECRDASDCGGDRPFCGFDGVCIGCRTAGDCPTLGGVRRTCDLGLRECVENPCTSDDHCALDPSGRRTCDVGSGACVQCLDDAACPGQRCDVDSRLCVACVEDADCNASLGESCNTQTNVCEVSGCGSDLMCAGPLRCALDSRECVQCVDSADCVFGGLCSQGRCVEVGACAADGDCPFPQRCTGDGVCAQCVDSGDCRGGQSCVAGACVEPASCTDSASCGPGRECAGGVCQPSACAADAFEPNDTVLTAFATNPRTLAATLCPNEEDFYSVELQEEGGVRMTLRYDGALGPLALELLPAPGARSGLAVGVEERAGLVRAVIESADAHTIAAVARVTSRSGGVVPYELLIESTASPLCADDADEEDDTMAQAPVVVPGEFTGIACPGEGEADWKAIDVPEGFTLHASLELLGGVVSGHAQVEIFTMRGTTLWREAFGFSQAKATTVAPAGGQRFWVVVRNVRSRKVSYRLRTDLVPQPPANDLCQTDPARATLLDHNATTSGHVRGAVDDGAASCGGERGADAFFFLRLDEPSSVRLDLTASFPAVLSLSQGCASEGELGCAVATGAATRLAFDGLPAGDWVVRVDAEEGHTGVFTLAAEVDAAPGAPSGSCDVADALAFEDGVANVQGNLALASDDVTAGCGAPGGDAAYALVLEAPVRVRATLTAFDGASVSLVPAAGCEAMTGALCRAAAGAGFTTVLDDTLVEAGEWRLVVDGGSSRQGAFSLRVELLDAIAPPANDTCEDAADLGESATADLRGASDAFTPPYDPADPLPPASCRAAVSEGRDAVYRFSVDADGDERDQVTLALEADFDASLVVQRAGCGTGEVIACADGDRARVVLPALEAGEYFVWVDAFESGTGAFTLTKSQQRAPPAPSNDACADAEPVALGETPVEVTGSTRRALADHAPADCRAGGAPLELGGPDVVYAVQVPAGRTLVATLTPSADFDAALYVVDGCDAQACVVAADASYQSGGVETVRATNAAGAPVLWHVVVDSWQAQASGEFTLRLELEP